MNVDTVLKKLTAEIPMDKPNWEVKRGLLLQKPLFCSKQSASEKNKS